MCDCAAAADSLGRPVTRRRWTVRGWSKGCAGESGGREERRDEGQERQETREEKQEQTQQQQQWMEERETRCGTRDHVGSAIHAAAAADATVAPALLSHQQQQRAQPASALAPLSSSAVAGGCFSPSLSPSLTHAVCRRLLRWSHCSMPAPRVKPLSSPAAAASAAATASAFGDRH